MPLTPILGIVTCLMLMFSLPGENWLRLVVWLAIGFAIYFYLRHPPQRHGQDPGPRDRHSRIVSRRIG